MPVDSAAVNKAIAAEIWPQLRDSGFSRFSSRTAWRYHADRVDVVNFQSFGADRAGVLGIAPLSFAVNLGCYLTYIPSHDPAYVKERSGQPVPEEAQCHMRGALRRGYFDFRYFKRSIWRIDASGNNVAKALHDVQQGLARTGLEWFKQFDSPHSVYSILAEREEVMDKLWGFGRRGSPIRYYFLGYAALAAGKTAEARANILQAAQSGCFSHALAQLHKDAGVVS